jgi:hypothetical protein
VNETAYGLYYVGQLKTITDVGFYSGRNELSIGSSRGRSVTTVIDLGNMAGNQAVDSTVLPYCKEF